MHTFKWQIKKWAYLNLWRVFFFSLCWDMINYPAHLERGRKFKSELTFSPQSQRWELWTKQRVFILEKNYYRSLGLCLYTSSSLKRCWNSQQFKQEAYLTLKQFLEFDTFYCVYLHFSKLVVYKIMKTKDLIYAKIISHHIKQFLECYLPSFSGLRSSGAALCSSANEWAILRRLHSAG